MFKPACDKTGKRYGRLTVLSYIDSSFDSNGKKRPAKWLCQCDCGNTIQSKAGNLTSGNTTSCGCLGDECRQTNTKTHGMRKHPLYAVYRTMRDRCTNKSNSSYSRYGGRGITVCDRWKECFENFYEDMGHSWVQGLTLERLDNNLGYSLENCKWASRKEQARNRNSNRIINTAHGRMTVAEASEKYNIKQRTISMRIAYGWKEEDLLIPTNSIKVSR